MGVWQGRVAGYEVVGVEGRRGRFEDVMEASACVRESF